MVVFYLAARKDTLLLQLNIPLNISNKLPTTCPDAD